MACVGAVAVQKVIAAENLLENGHQTGEYLVQFLHCSTQAVAKQKYTLWDFTSGTVSTNDVCNGVFYRL
jgi:hypothetical protein